MQRVQIVTTADARVRETWIAEVDDDLAAEIIADPEVGLDVISEPNAPIVEVSEHVIFDSEHNRDVESTQTLTTA